MKKLFLFMSFVVIFGIIYLAILNGSEISLLYTKSGATITLSLSLLIVMTLLIGLIISSSIIYLFFYKEEQTRVKAYKRELEKTSIQGSNSESKVEVLEAKIKVLEKAFDSMLDERTKLELQIKSLNAELEAINKRKNK